MSLEFARTVETVTYDIDQYDADMVNDELAQLDIHVMAEDEMIEDLEDCDKY